MLMIGRRLFIEKATGKVIKDTGERMGNVIETTPEVDFPEYDPNTMDIMELTFGERSDEINKAGSLKVLAGELVIYPRLKLEVDKQTIPSNGTDFILVTPVFPEGYTPEAVGFSINESDPVILALLEFSSTLPGRFTITAKHELFGSVSIEVEVI